MPDLHNALNSSSIPAYNDSFETGINLDYLHADETLTPEDFDEPYIIFDYHNKKHIMSENEMPIKNGKCCPDPDNYGYVLNTRTGKRIVLGCKKWLCPVCGPKRKAIMFHACNNYFRKFRYVRLWTFTMTSSLFTSVENHYTALKEVWRRLIWELRRSRSFSPKDRAFRFVKVLELHKSGFIHIHALCDTYFDILTLLPIFKRIVTEVLGTSAHCASINMVGLESAKVAAGYVVKYITKACHELPKNIRRWSKSEHFALFEKSESSKEWAYIPWHSVLQECPEDVSLLISSLLANRGLTSQEKSEKRDLKHPLLFSNST